MLIPKRLIVWLIETTSEALLLGMVLAVLLGYDQNAFLKDVLIYSSAISMLFFSTGYVLSTIIARAIWKGQTLWSYPAVATILFLVHFEIMNIGVGGAFKPTDRLRIRVAGAFITIVCTFVGTLLLRRMTIGINAV